MKARLGEVITCENLISPHIFFCPEEEEEIFETISIPKACDLCWCEQGPVSLQSSFRVLFPRLEFSPCSRWLGELLVLILVSRWEKAAAHCQLRSGCCP